MTETEYHLRCELNYMKENLRTAKAHLKESEEENKVQWGQTKVFFL